MGVSPNEAMVTPVHIIDNDLEFMALENKFGHPTPSKNKDERKK